MLARLAKNKIFWLVVVTLISIATLSSTSKSRDSLMFYEKALSYVYIPVQKGLAYVAYNIHDMLTYFDDAKAMSEENKNLKLRLEQIEEENRGLSELKVENDRLLGELELKGKFENYDTVVSRIIAKEMGNWFNIFTIDKGSKDGIEVNMTVITPKGLVGQVVSATPEASKVMAIIDSGSSVSARLSKTRDLVIVRGDLSLKDNGLIKMNFIPVGVEVAEGDIVVTSGIGGIFPRDIMIGKVVNVDNNKPQLMRYAVVQPEVDFKRLEEVMVLKNK